MMQDIHSSRALLGATPGTSLQELSVLYKGLMKRHHPDRFQEEEARQEAEAVSTRIIAAYKYLVSIHPETQAAQEEEFLASLESGLRDWTYERRTLKLTLGDGSSHEFLNVPPNVYNKFTRGDGTLRFIRRNLLGTFARRRAAVAVEA